MQRAPWWQLLLGVIAGAALVLVMLEILFRVLPVSTATETGYYIDPEILTYPAGHRFTTATGWNLRNAQSHRANNAGFLSEHDFSRDAASIAVIGDSYVEGTMLQPQDRLGPQLETRLGRPVYALGSPGTALLDYAERMRFAHEQYGIGNFVLLLEQGDLVQSLCGSGNVNSQCLDRATLEPRTERQAAAGTLKRVLRHLALPQYLFSQIKLDPARWAKSLFAGKQAPSAPAAAPSSGPSEQAIIDRVLAEFFERTTEHRTGQLIIVLNGSRDLIDKPNAVRDSIRALAERNGAVLIDAAPLLHDLETRTGLSSYVAPSDHHLNRLALGAIAEQVANGLQVRPQARD